MYNWLTKLAELNYQGTPCILVTVASIVGSTPREVGAKIIVTADDMFGTIGGGNLEFQACKLARDQLDNPEPQQLKRFPLGAGLGQCCGGLVNLLFEPVIEVCDWIESALGYERLNREWVREVPIQEGPVNVRRFDDDDSGLVANVFVEVNRSVDVELILFGAGHVGRAVVKAMTDLPLRIRWVDSREKEFPKEVSDNVEVICTDIPEAEVDAAKPDSYYLVMTHEHGLDQRLCEEILKRDDFTYFGLIGSISKRRMFETRMLRRGIESEKFKNMICPIGVEGISSKQPAMIAISVVAQIMQYYDQRLLKQKEINLSSTGRRSA